MIGELMCSFGMRSREGTERASGFVGALLDTDGAGVHTFAGGFAPPPPPHPAAVTASSAPAATPKA
ncbi:hypothetical protein [Actinoallomurus iriomotensis]|uniref:hypothetical protein n=1 Tax=Actinoallomurus iriomotensis TaxID=478107 RepID=UPI002555E99D|nr:hypothetical protein [Actinoallomurus iriomotensis]